MNQTLTAHRGTLVLVLGILSWFLCPVVLGITAWIMGSADLTEMDAGRMDPEGRSITQAGKILGMINVILSALSLAVFLVFVLFFATWGIHNG